MEEKQSLSDRIKAELESVNLQLALGSMNARDNWEKEGKKVASQLREIGDHLGQLSSKAEEDPRMEEHLGNARTKAEVVASILELKKARWKKEAEELSSEACEGMKQMEESIRELLDSDDLEEFRIEFENKYDTTLLQIAEFLLFQEQYVKAKMSEGKEELSKLMDYLSEKKRELEASVL